MGTLRWLEKVQKHWQRLGNAVGNASEQPHIYRRVARCVAGLMDKETRRHFAATNADFRLQPRLTQEKTLERN